MQHKEIKRVFSFRAMIAASLKEGQMIEGFENSFLSRNKTQVLNKDESEYWDYKEDIDLTKDPEIAKLSKQIMGFYNLKGGVLIFGISNDFKVKGVFKTKIFDNIRIRNKIKKFLSKEILFFQNQIELNDHKILWLIFVPPRGKESPVQVNLDFTDINTGKRILSKSHYIIRDGDQFKACTDPFDYERCFSDINHNHLYAYLYDIDEPYYRLLSPHQDKFIGRTAILDDLMTNLNSRSYIIALDGLGGVGKSAIAIEFIKRLYKSNNYDFIVSLSAKNKVWEGKISSRQAGFSGLYEMIAEIAKVLQIDTINKNLDELQSELKEGMKGLNGIIFIDNLETVNDSEIIAFLKDGIPEPVKVLITTKVVKDVPARTVSIPEMEKAEALELLYFELEKLGYNNFINEKDEVTEIIERTNYFPLAIKWAASLITGKKNLKEVLNLIKQSNANKKEFLSFCFSSIFDELTPLAKDCALQIPYLGEKWNELMLSISLNKTPQEITEAILELGERGLLLTGRKNQKNNIRVLPLTIDFLSNKFHENKILRSKISLNISTHLISNITSSSIHDAFGDIEKLLDVLEESAPLLIDKKDYQKAFPVIQLAIQTISDSGRSDLENKYLSRFRFLEGKMNYEFNKIKLGLGQMIYAYKRADKLNPNDAVYLGEAILEKGSIDNRDLGIRLLIENLSKANDVKNSSISEIFNYHKKVGFEEENKYMNEDIDKIFIEKIVSKNYTSNVSYFIIKELKERNLMPDLKSELYLKENMKRMLKHTLESELLEDDLKKYLLDYQTNNLI